MTITVAQMSGLPEESDTVPSIEQDSSLEKAIPAIVNTTINKRTEFDNYAFIQ